MAYAFRGHNKGTPSFTGMYMGPYGKSAGPAAKRGHAERRGGA
jgi:hypothetical protein